MYKTHNIIPQLHTLTDYISKLCVVAFILPSFSVAFRSHAVIHTTFSRIFYAYINLHSSGSILALTTIIKQKIKILVLFLSLSRCRAQKTNNKFTYCVIVFLLRNRSFCVCHIYTRTRITQMDNYLFLCCVVLLALPSTSIALRIESNTENSIGIGWCLGSFLEL